MTAIHRFVEQARRGDHPRVIARLASGWAVLGGSQLLAGYSLLCPDPVVGSLNDLDEAGRAAFLLDMARLGDAVLKVCRPQRLNYAMLGNVEPALHAHVIPRYDTEPAEMQTKPIWNYPPEVWDAKKHQFSRAKHGRVRAAIERALASSVPQIEAPMWQAAAAMASRVHEGQVRKDGCTPYVSHCFRVAMTVRDIFGCSDASTLAAALLHDTIEDRNADFDEISEHFGEVVASLVATLSKDQRMPEKSREPVYDRQVASGDWRARLIKLADVYDNYCDGVEQGGEALKKRAQRCRRAVDIARNDRAAPALLHRAADIVDELLSRPRRRRRN